LVLHLLLFSLVNELYFVFPSQVFSALSRGESDAKIHPFSFPFQIFQQLFSKNFRGCHQSPIDLHLTKKFFFEGFCQLPANSRTYPYPFSSTYRV
ncbi:hypothetical protein NW211_11955, partial [Barnesiella sp. ET7]|uniref:hypothetical protein n=1 Tax=Barnesiella sp. ET7 TaxID=2972460 RepID=UPI0021ACB574